MVSMQTFCLANIADHANIHVTAINSVWELMKVKQIDIAQRRVSIDTPVAIIKYGPEYFEKQMLISFDEGFDDFDYYKFALLELPDSKQFALQRYTRNPYPGTAIWITGIANDFDLEIVTMEIANILDALDLTDSDLTWKITDEMRKHKER